MAEGREGQEATASLVPGQGLCWLRPSHLSVSTRSLLSGSFRFLKKQSEGEFSAVISRSFCCHRPRCGWVWEGAASRWGGPKPRATCPRLQANRALQHLPLAAQQSLSNEEPSSGPGPPHTAELCVGGRGLCNSRCQAQHDVVWSVHWLGRPLSSFSVVLTDWGLRTAVLVEGRGCNIPNFRREGTSGVWRMPGGGACDSPAARRKRSGPAERLLQLLPGTCVLGAG